VLILEGKVEKTMEFKEKIKKKARVVLRNAQKKKIKRQADRERKEVKK